MPRGEKAGLLDDSRRFNMEERRIRVGNLPFTEIYNLPNFKPLALQFKTEI